MSTPKAAWMSLVGFPAAARRWRNTPPQAVLRKATKAGMQFVA
ncbi:MAG TPA: hypothetical protein VF797_16495 [Noviherbaspirillum sp.]